MAAGTEIAVIDDAGHLLRSGEIGEIVVSGPHAMQGYLNDPKDNKTTFANGRFRTGDRGTWILTVTFLLQVVSRRLSTAAGKKFRRVKSMKYFWIILP